MTDLIALDDRSRVWIYQADSFFEEEQLPELISEIRDFVNQWVSHSRDLRAYGNIFHQRFVCLFVDESQAGASGCSIDSSVRFINDLGKKYSKNMMQRDHFAYIKDNEIFSIHMQEMPQAKISGIISEETLFFDNLVASKEQFISSWLKPLGESWHSKFS